MKAMLIADIPNEMLNDTTCVTITSLNSGMSFNAKLKPMPEKESEKHREEIEDWTGLAYSQGWNACIEAILGEEDE